MKKALVLVFAFGLALALLTGCTGTETETTTETTDTTATETAAVEGPPEMDDPQREVAPTDLWEGDMPEVKIEIQGYDEPIMVQLNDKVAPITVENFLDLVDRGFYDGLTFHRIMKGFMIQGGDPDGNGTGGSGTNIKGEFASNGVENPIRHERGVISMARSGMPDSASSQFFIMHQDSPFLDGDYAAFGRVTSGMDVVDSLAENAPVTDNNGTVPRDAQPVITHITRVN